MPRRVRSRAVRRADASASAALVRLAAPDRTNTIARTREPFPPSMVVDIVYVENEQFPTGLPSADLVWCVNSAYDPYRTGGGHQPRYFDQLCAANGPYNQYRVLWCDVDVVVGVSGQSTGAAPMLVTLVPSIASASLLSSGAASELPGATPEVMFGGFMPPARIRRRFYPHSILGLTPEQYAADVNSPAAWASNPIDTAFVHAFVESADGTTSVVAFARTRLTMRVQFFDRPNIAPS